MTTRAGISTFTAAPFDGVAQARPEAGGPRAARAPSLRTSIAARVQPTPARPAHVPPQPAPWQKVDTAAEPESVTHAVQMREALKAGIAATQAQLSTMPRNDPRRDATVNRAKAMQARSADLAAWVRRENGAATKAGGGLNSEGHVGLLLAILDRLEDDGARFSDDERVQMDAAAAFVAWCEEQVAVRRALAAGKVPQPE